MQMMIENPKPEISEEGMNQSDLSPDKTLRELVEVLEDGEVISVSLEGMVVNNG